jgi:hypothetical protein
VLVGGDQGDCTFLKLIFNEWNGPNENNYN